MNSREPLNKEIDFAIMFDHCGTLKTIINSLQLITHKIEINVRMNGVTFSAYGVGRECRIAFRSGGKYIVNRERSVLIDPRTIESEIAKYDDSISLRIIMPARGQLLVDLDGLHLIKDNQRCVVRKLSEIKFVLIPVNAKESKEVGLMTDNRGITTGIYNLNEIMTRIVLEDCENVKIKASPTGLKLFLVGKSGDILGEYRFGIRNQFIMRTVTFNVDVDLFFAIATRAILLGLNEIGITVPNDLPVIFTLVTR